MSHRGGPVPEEPAKTLVSGGSTTLPVTDATSAVGVGVESCTAHFGNLGGELVPRPQRLVRFPAAVRRGDVPAVPVTPVLRDGEAALPAGLRHYRPDGWRRPE